MTVPSVAPVVRYRGPLTVLCCLAMFLYAVYFGAIGVILPSLGETFGLGPAVQGALFPAQFAGFVPGVILAGYLSDRFGRKGVLLIGIAAYALGLLCFGIAPQFGWLLAASVLIGGGSGAMETVASVLATDLYPERRAFVVNALQIAFGAGAAVGPYVAQILLGNGLSWRSLYFGFMAANLALFAMLAFIPLGRTDSGDDEAIDFRALIRILRQPAYLALCLAQALYVGAEVAFGSWMPTYFRLLPGGIPLSGPVVTIFWIAMTIGRTIVSPLAGRIPLLRLTIVLALLSAVFAVGTLLTDTPVTVTVCVVGVGLCFSGIFGLILAEAGERYPAVSGSAFGGIMASGGVGGALLPWLVGIAATLPFGWRGALLLVPIASLGVALLAYAVGRKTVTTVP
ncbi:MAG: MFS transporter [Capsulimonadales bacterium]|nr:MFS transporter [Capsulimonadales bacterium]